MTLRSLLDPEALREIVRQSYGLDVTDCVLLRSFVNDVYMITTASARYVLKVYRHDRRPVNEIAWELELAGHLAERGVPVPGVVLLSDGRLLGLLEAPEGPRPYALSVFFDGGKPQSPFDDDLYRDFGRLTATFHTAGDAFATSHRRRPFDLSPALAEPLAQVLPALADRPDDQALVRELGAEARHRIEKSVALGLDWGVCHGDVTLDNVLTTPGGGLAIYDFDLAAPGWRALDLTGVHATVHWEAFADGYTQVRALGENDLAMLPWFTVVAHIANLGFHLVDKPTFRGTESVAEGWAQDGLDCLRVAAAKLL